MFSKYHKNNKYLLNLLIANSFHCSSKVELNDPFDLQIKLSRNFVAEILCNECCDINGDHVFKVFIDKIEPFMSGVNQQDKDLNAKLKIIFRSSINQMLFSQVVIDFFEFKVVSFSKQIELQHETLMWAHYAGFDGVKLLFDIPPFFEGFMDQYSIEKVNYRSTIFTVKSEKDIGKALLFKNLQWQYEKEYRIVTKEDSSKLGFDKQCLKGMVFGSHMSNEEKCILLRMCSSLGYDLEYYQLEVLPSRFKISKIGKDNINAALENECTNFLSKIQWF
jgi:hypothetical protein